MLDLMVDSNYRGMADLFRGWGALRDIYDGAAGDQAARRYDIRIPAIPPFYRKYYAAHYRATAGTVGRPPVNQFYRNE